MKLLDKVRERGYNVHDRKNEFGSRVITIDGDGAWVRCVFRRGCTLTDAKNKVQFLQRSVRNLLQDDRNP